ncbi:Uncharacterised protein [Burkholderia gladioli]|nr:Uncharacterised protein [Burkholderia gladioli]
MKAPRLVAMRLDASPGPLKYGRQSQREAGTSPIAWRPARSSSQSSPASFAPAVRTETPMMAIGGGNTAPARPAGSDGCCAGVAWRACATGAAGAIGTDSAGTAGAGVAGAPGGVARAGEAAGNAADEAIRASPCEASRCAARVATVL